MGHAPFRVEITWLISTETSKAQGQTISTSRKGDLVHMAIAVCVWYGVL